MIGKLCLVMLGLGVSSEGPAMLRILKYRNLTEVTGSRVCVSAKHEFNPKPENRAKPLNGKDPITCKLTVLAEVSLKSESRLVSGSQRNKFVFNSLQKTCIDLRAELKPGEKVAKFAGLQTECSESKQSKGR